MDNNFGYYVFCLIAIIVGLFIMKKITGCIVRIVIFGIVVAALAAAYFMFIR